jgi:hypothetical protein
MLPNAPFPFNEDENCVNIETNSTREVAQISPIDDELAQLIRQHCLVAHQFFPDVGRWLLEALNKSNNEVWMFYLNYGRQALNNYEVLQQWETSRIEFISWPVRNLFEILLWVSFLDIDPANKDEFVGQVAKTRHGIDEAYRTMNELSPVPGIRQRTKQELANYWKEILSPQNFGVKFPKARKTTRQIAEAVQLDKEYDIIFAFASAYTHPTPFSAVLMESNGGDFMNREKERLLIEAIRTSTMLLKKYNDIADKAAQILNTP